MAYGSSSRGSSSFGSFSSSPAGPIGSGPGAQWQAGPVSGGGGMPTTGGWGSGPNFGARASALSAIRGGGGAPSVASFGSATPMLQQAAGLSASLPGGYPGSNQIALANTIGRHNPQFWERALFKDAAAAGKADRIYLEASGMSPNTTSMGGGGGGGSAMGGMFNPQQMASAGMATGFALTQEALGLQNQLEDLTRLSGELRKLGVSQKLIDSAEKNLLGLAAGSSNHMNNPAFKQTSKYIEDQMARRLSPTGYAPGQHGYGDAILAQTQAGMAQDWTQWWAEHNRDILGMGNQIATVGAQGQVRAGELGVQTNPFGLAAASIPEVAWTNQNPNQAFSWWANQNLEGRFPGLSGLINTA